MTKRKKFGISKGLTEGLSQTVMAVKNNAGSMRYEVLPLSKVELDPENPRNIALSIEDVNGKLSKEDPDYERKLKEKDSLRSLANTINDKGVLSPIWVYKVGENYRLAAGERRVLASLIAGKQDIPAKILEEKPGELDLRLLQWIENIEREDLTLWEKVGNLQVIVNAMMAERDGESTVTASEIATILGCSRQNANNYALILNAPNDVKDAIAKGLIKNLEKAATISAIKALGLRRKAIEQCAGGSTLKELRAIVSEQKESSHQPAPAKAKAAPAEKRGRKAAKVSFGSTANPVVARILIESVLAHDAFNHHLAEFQEIDWSDYREVNLAFKRLLKIIERSPAVAK